MLRASSSVPCPREQLILNELLCDVSPSKSSKDPDFALIVSGYGWERSLQLTFQMNKSVVVART